LRTDSPAADLTETEFRPSRRSSRRSASWLRHMIAYHLDEATLRGMKPVIAIEPREAAFEAEAKHA